MTSDITQGYRNSLTIADLTQEIDEVAVRYANGHVAAEGEQDWVKRKAANRRAVYDAAVAAREAAKALDEANDALTTALKRHRDGR